MYDLIAIANKLRLRPMLVGAALFSVGIVNAVWAAPAYVLITLPPGAAAPAEYAAQLAAWRQSGQVSSAFVLDQNQKEKPGFASLAILEFPSDVSYQAWQKEAAPKLGAALSVKRADVLAHGEKTPRDSTKSVFRVNVYQTSTSAANYAEFVNAYIVPNMEAQKNAGILLRYSMYLDRDPAGMSRSILVKEYRDSLAYSRMDATANDLKKRMMASDAVFRKFEDTKNALRTGTSETVALNVELLPPQLTDLPPYKPEFKVVGGFRMIGSELKNATPQLAEGFAKFHPGAKMTTSHVPSSEGGIAGLYLGLSDVAPMGDDAKITDMMPFWNTFGYMPTEISVATGGYEKRGSLFAWAIVVSEDNPLNEISVDQLERVFGSERSGGWEFVDNDYRFTSKFARGADTNIRKWGQLGLKGEFADREIQTFGYVAPGFATYIERNWFHWSHKWNANFMEYVEAKQTSPDALGALVASERPLEKLKGNKFSIGIGALMHVKNYPGLKVLKIAPRGGGAAVALTPENVANRVYPLIRDAFFYVNKAPGQKLDPRVREFMRFVLSREGQEIMARVGYYYPLKADYLREQLKKLD